MAAKAVFLKLGGSLITDKSKDRVFREDVARRLGEEIRSAMNQQPMRLVLGHGAGGFGHNVARRHGVRNGLPAGGGWKGYVLTRAAVLDLSARVVEALADRDFYPVPLQPSAVAVARGGRLASMDLSVLRRILDAGQTPMICGDAVMDDELGFTIVSTEGFFSYLADYLAPDRIILASDVDGVFDSDPKDNDDVRRLGAIDGANLDGVLSRLTAGSGADVTGGMAGKVKAAHELAWKLPDADVRIVGGLVPDRVRGALVGHGGGTRIRP